MVGDIDGFLDGWNELVKKFENDEIGQEAIVMFMYGLEVQRTLYYIDNLEKDAQWREETLKLAHRQTIALERIAKEVVNGQSA